jgi:hypothetical protein
MIVIDSMVSTLEVTDEVREKKNAVVWNVMPRGLLLNLRHTTGRCIANKVSQLPP